MLPKSEPVVAGVFDLGRLPSSAFMGLRFIVETLSSGFGFVCDSVERFAFLVARVSASGKSCQGRR